MDWLERMNAAVDYIEDNIMGNIDYRQAARIACCPNYHFQRMFSFIAGIPLSEYIRRRRLTLAAFELQRSNMSVIEIAQKYGYESHSAFTRAFSELHGAAPVAARKPGAKLKAYPRMSFQISIKGGEEMNYSVEKTGAFAAAGFKYRVKTGNAHSAIPLIWEEIRRNGAADNLLELAGNYSGGRPGGILGICSDGDWGGNDEFSYYVAALCDKETPGGMERVDFPESQWVVFEAPAVVDILKSWERLYTDWLPASGYSLADLPAVECYYPPEHRPQNELRIPIIRNG
jgi:AraC family transcriptional regulator